jgi:hypothetical protein
MSNDGSLITEYYPLVPYNFDVPPNPYLIGPLKSIFEVVEARLVQLYADIAGVQVQLSVQNATGSYLDAHGVLYATPRIPGELDVPYRARILEARSIGKLTLFAIQAAVSNYLVSATSADGGVLAGSDVYDLRSNPAACVTDATNGYTVQVLDFIVEVDVDLSVDDAFFLDYVELDYEAFLFTAGTTYGETQPDDPGLVAAALSKKAGGTNAVFKTVVTFTA